MALAETRPCGISPRCRARPPPGAAVRADAEGAPRSESRSRTEPGPRPAPRQTRVPRRCSARRSSRAPSDPRGPGLSTGRGQVASRDECRCCVRRVAAERRWPQSAGSERRAPARRSSPFRTQTCELAASSEKPSRGRGRAQLDGTSRAADGRFLDGSAATHGRHRPRTVMKRGSCDELLGFSGERSE